MLVEMDFRYRSISLGSRQVLGSSGLVGSSTRAFAPTTQRRGGLGRSGQ